MMKERIREFLKRENKSSAQFAEEIGVQPSSISHILSGRNKPSLDFVIKMLEKYSFLSVSWLLFGKGEMYNKEHIIPDLFSGYQDIENEKPTESYGTPDEEKAGDTLLKKKSEAPGILKIIWFYNDNSFEEFIPRIDK